MILDVEVYCENWCWHWHLIHEQMATKSLYYWGSVLPTLKMTSYVEMSISSDHWRAAIYYVKPPIWGLIWTNFCQSQYFYDILWGAQMRIQWWRVGERTCSNQNVFPFFWEQQFIPHLNGVSITLWSYLMISFKVIQLRDVNHEYMFSPVLVQ